MVQLLRQEVEAYAEIKQELAVLADAFQVSGGGGGFNKCACLSVLVASVGEISRLFWQTESEPVTA